MNIPLATNSVIIIRSCTVGRLTPSRLGGRRGMGDSEGEPRSFDRIEDDIRDAMKEYFNQMPDMKEVVIWGLCDAATAASFPPDS
jgi:hypothetical protein